MFYIHPDQVGFIKGRHLKDNIRRTINIINCVKPRIIPSVLCFLDAEMAFDLLDWSFLKRVISEMGLGDHFLTWINLIYSPQTV